VVGLRGLWGRSVVVGFGRQKFTNHELKCGGIARVVGSPSGGRFWQAKIYQSRAKMWWDCADCGAAHWWLDFNLARKKIPIAIQNVVGLVGFWGRPKSAIFVAILFLRPSERRINFSKSDVRETDKFL
jgi:hypothetical protein